MVRTTRLPALRLLAVALSLVASTSACGGSDAPAGPSDPVDTNVEPLASFVLESSGSTAPVGIAVDGSESRDPDGEIAGWAWDFGDGATATGAYATHVFEATGTFEIRLTVTDDAGSQTSTTRSVTVSPGSADRVVGVVWHDVDNDGMRDASEGGVARQRVFVDLDGDGSRDPDEPTALTGAGGVYQIAGLAPGPYRVTQELGIGWTNTAPGPAPTGLSAAASGAATAGDFGGNVPVAGLTGSILGGDDAPDAFPFMASIQVAQVADRRAAHICGGSLVAPQWVLTASHCLSDENGQPFPDGFLEVLIGTTRLDGSGVRIPIDRVELNPGYSPSGGFYKRDVSLVRLATRVADRPRVFLMDSTTLTTRVRAGDLGTIPGWGRLGDAAGIPVALQVAEIPLRPNQDCRDAWNAGEVERFDATMLCVGHRAGTPDTCSGDSGGPWVFDVAGRLHQAGAVSWGPVPCGRPTIPSAFASIPAMYAFLAEHIPTEPSGRVDVVVGDGTARADFGNFH